MSNQARFGTLERAPVIKNTSTAADAADDVKRRDAVYREGQVATYAECLEIVRNLPKLWDPVTERITAPSIEEAARRIEEAMNG